MIKGRLVVLLCVLSSISLAIALAKAKEELTENTPASEANAMMDKIYGKVSPHLQRQRMREMVDAVEKYRRDFPPSVQPARRRASGFTVIIASYRRMDLYKQVVEHYCKIAEVHKVMLIWNNPDLDDYPAPDPRSFNCTRARGHLLTLLHTEDSRAAGLLLQSDAAEMKVEVLPQLSSKVHNRVKYPHLVETDAILQIDDDILVDEEGVRLAFAIWNSNPKRLVGFNARSHTVKDGKLFYMLSSFVSYSMLIGSGFFYHKAFAELFLSDHPLASKLSELVDAHHEYDDIGFNVLVQYFTGVPPYLVSVNTKDLQTQTSGHAGMWLQEGWMTIRSEALRETSKIFDNPLRFADDVTTKLGFTQNFKIVPFHPRRRNQ